MNFYSANGNLIKKKLVENYSVRVDMNVPSSTIIDSSDTFKSIESTENKESNDDRKTIIQNKLIKQCGLSKEDTKLALADIENSRVYNPNVEISSTFINFGPGQKTNNSICSKIPGICEFGGPNVDPSCMEDLFNEYVNYLSEETACRTAGYKSCANKKEAEDRRMQEENKKEEEIKREKEETACRTAGYTSCANKKEEEGCKKLGFDSCDNKNKEEACKSAGFKSCAHKAEEEASGISNNLIIIIIGLLVLLYFLFNKSN
jgi:hypothetical protein